MNSEQFQTPPNTVSLANTAEGGVKQSVGLSAKDYSAQ